MHTVKHCAGCQPGCVQRQEPTTTQQSPGALAQQGDCRGAYLPRLGGGVPDAVESILGLSLGACGFEQPKIKQSRQQMNRPQPALAGTLQPQPSVRVSVFLPFCSTGPKSNRLCEGRPVPGLGPRPG